MLKVLTITIRKLSRVNLPDLPTVHSTTNILYLQSNLTDESHDVIQVTIHERHFSFFFIVGTKFLQTI